MQYRRVETLCAFDEEQRALNLGAAAPPIYQSSTFAFPDCESFLRRESPDSGRFDYTRVSNPTTRLLERKAAALEGGEACRAFGSGMGAVSAAILSCVRAGDHVVCVDTAYGPTRTFLTEYLPRFGVEATFVPGVAVADFDAAVRPRTRLLYVESPSSLVFAIQDLRAIAGLARQRGLRTVCDNSCATPCFQRPIALGIDLVVHSAAKYLAGHSDLICGLVIGRNELLAPLIEYEGKLLGAVLDPFAAWLTLRGLRTLSLRMERHQAAGLAAAEMLAAHPKVERVFHPGLPSHPGHATARAQMNGFSGMLSFRLRDPSREAACRVVDALRLFGIAVSWGGYDSLAIPHQQRFPGEAEPRWGIRLSMGLESVDDLLADLRQALDAC